QGIIPIPERYEHVRVDSGYHLFGKVCPRSALRTLIIPFRPEGRPGLPIPRYFAKTLFSLTGRTRTSSPSRSKTILSPGLTPSAWRTSRGTVIWPLLVIFASLCIDTSPSIPYVSTRLL